MPPAVLPARHHTSDRRLPCCVPRGSECLPKARHSTIQPSHSESKLRHQEASAWVGRVNCCESRASPSSPCTMFYRPELLPGNVPISTIDPLVYSPVILRC